jgi:hypothetical protein
LARAAIISLVAVLSLAAVPHARADGDPASDYLLGEPSFVPPDAGVPPAYANQLNDVLRDALARGYRLRVALIATRNDMGSVAVLFRQPQSYARFLGKELAFVYKGNLLVAMPNGFGVTRRGRILRPDQAVVDRLRAPGGTGVALASAATRAVVQLAGRAGIIVTLPPLRGSRSHANQSHDRLTIVVAAAVAALLIAIATLARRRFRNEAV